MSESKIMLTIDDELKNEAEDLLKVLILSLVTSLLNQLYMRLMNT